MVLPLTPLHYPVAYLISKTDKKLLLPGLAIGAMFPDLEIPPILFFSLVPGYNRLVLHSLLGLPIATILSAISVSILYPYIISFLFGIKRENLKEKYAFSRILILSCFIGNLSHVLLDLANHDYNPILWPILPFVSSPICTFLGGIQNASLILHSFLGIIFLLIIILNRKNIQKVFL